MRESFADRDGFLSKSLQNVTPKSPKGEKLEHCEECNGSGLLVFAENGDTKASLCNCTAELDWQHRSELDNKAQHLSNADIPPLFANKSYKGKAFEEVVPEKIKTWLDNICDPKNSDGSNLLFLCGSVGNGKTHIASDCVKRFILKTGNHAKFLQAEDLIEAKKDADFYGDRKNRDEKRHLDYQRRIMKHVGLLVVDDIGRTRISQWGLETFDHFFDIRYRAKLPTLLISNHTFDRKTSVDGVTIAEVIGQRTADRLKECLLVEVNGPSKRNVRNPKNKLLSEITEEEKRNFCLPTPILKLQEGELQVLNWITRNPVFEPINDRDRKQAVDQNGEPVFNHSIPVDQPRCQPKVCKDVWQRGDKLIIDGPILGEDDAKTYLACLELLKREHAKNNLGLTVTCTTADLMKSVGKRSCNAAGKIALQRSLMRISGAVISYIDNVGRQWKGPLFTIYYDPNTFGGHYEIAFNQSMVTFYSTCEYTKLHKKLFEARIGTDGLRMQMFLRSHDSDRFERLDFDGWMKFLEKPFICDPSKFSSSQLKNERRKGRKKFSELLKKQIDAGLLSSNSNLKRGSNRIALTVLPL